jgi:DNA-binding transcriptional regulator YiaG
MAAAKKGTQMTGAQYQKAIDRLNLSQVESALMLHVNDRTVRRWISNDVPIPHSVAIVFKLMTERGISPDEIVELFKRKKKAKAETTATA